MEALRIVKLGWGRILRSFYKWLREVKGYELPDSADSLIDEWIDMEVTKMGETVATVASLFGRGAQPMTDDEPLDTGAKERP